MTTRLNKTNRPEITDYIIKRFDYKSQNREDGKKNFLSIIDIWNVQHELQDKFNISDQSSQKITWDVYGHKQVSRCMMARETIRNR